MTYQPVFELLAPFSLEKVYTDEETGAYRKISVWRAKLNVIPEGVYMIGDVAVPAYPDTIPNISVVLVKPLIRFDSRGEIIKPPMDYDEIWYDKGSGGRYNGSFWHPRAPPGYVALGDVSCNNWTKPPNEFTAKYACIRQDLLTGGVLSSPALWDDMGSGAIKPVSIWSVEGFYQPTGCFKAHPSFDRPAFYQDVHTLPVAKIYSQECSIH